MNISDWLFKKKNSNTVTSGLPSKRIAAFLVLTKTKRTDRDELCELLLDGVQTDLGGNPRRFFIDNNTWYDCWTSSPNLPFIQSIKKIIDQTAGESEPILLAQLMRQLQETSGIEVLVDALRLHMFTYDNEDGATMTILEDKKIGPTSILKCRKCGMMFDFSTTAEMMTVEEVYDFFTSAGSTVNVHESNLERPSSDLVAESPDSVNNGVAPKVLSDLRNGKYRRWHHQGCDAVLGYPGAFFRTDLS